MEAKQINATLNWSHVGQYHSYGDTYRVCEIHTTQELSVSDILSLVDNRGKLPKEEFDSKQLTMSEYFTGYYTIEKTQYGYLYTGVEPYTD
jgi:hypothetical protein